MNDMVDTMAKDFLTSKCRGSNPAHLYFSKLFHEPWTIYLSGLKQPSLLKQACYDTLFMPRIKRYWTSHHDTPVPSFDTVDWASSAKAIKRLPPGLKRWRWKFSTGCIGVASQLYYRRYQDHSNCPLCQAPHEKVSHVLHCPDTKAVSFAKQKIQHHIPSTLEEHDTEPALSEAIQKILLHWRQGLPIRPTDFPISIRDLIREQSLLGWDNFVLGRWCPSWRKHQDEYYSSTGSLRTSLRWATAVIHKLLLTAWDLWDYRNGRLHGHAGPRELARHQSFNSDIAAEFALGSASLVVGSRHLLDFRSLDDLKKESLNGKRHWLQSVRAARSAFSAELANHIPAISAQARRFRTWLGISASPPVAP
jgi:hypothetical protein